MKIRAKDRRVAPGPITITNTRPGMKQWKSRTYRGAPIANWEQGANRFPLKDDRRT